MSGSWTSSAPRERIRTGGSARLSTFFDGAIWFRPGRMAGKSGILLLRVVWPVGAEAPRILSLITPQNRAGGRRDDHE